MCVGGVCDGELANTDRIQGDMIQLAKAEPSLRNPAKMESFGEFLERVNQPIKTGWYFKMYAHGIPFLASIDFTYADAIRHLIDCHRAPQA